MGMKLKLKHIGILFALGIGTHTIMHWDRIQIDGFSGEIWSVLRTPDTKYAPTYSHAGFNAVTIGMPQTEVLKQLGSPLLKWYPEDGIVAFQYSTSPTDSHYRLRQIYFKDHFVIKKTGYFWVD